MIFRLAAVFFTLVVSSTAGAWDFSDPVTVASAGTGVFHHLDSSGRKGMASNDGRLALVWEDNSSGRAQAYVAFGKRNATGFSKPKRVSPTGPAYEPVIAACGDGFVIGWEAAGRVWVRYVTTDRMGEAVALTEKPSRHLSLAETPDSDRVAAVWGEKRDRHYQIMQGWLTNCAAGPEPSGARLVDSSADKTEQLYPAVAVTPLGTVVAWEDRRVGATRIYTAFAPQGQGFLPWRLLNEFAPSPRPEYGRGTGAMRVVLDSDGEQKVVAVWLDKRNFEGGYDVYAAFSEDGGRSFGKNELVQDEFGENIPQWHAAGVMDADGRVVVAWDDTRDDTPDIWFSRRLAAGEWTDDENWPGSAGKGAQTFPVLLIDENGLHAAWQHSDGRASSIRYIHAR
jgi:hypothetical protein